ncbi:MAG: hypothetical protein ACYDIC_15975 [Desulfobaccales bacterium]
MDEQKPKDQLLSIPGVVALVLALGVILYSMAPLKGTRPPIPEVREELSPKVRTRLWQDPFRAVLDDAKAKGKEAGALPAGICPLGGSSGQAESQESLCPPRSPKPPREQICRRLENDKAGSVTILSVMVFGGPYAEDMESRIRHRYAILSGLGRLGFVPEDPEHIQFLLIKKEDQQENVAKQKEEKYDEKPTLQNILPFEWLSNKNDYVMILWINNDADVFRDQPFSKLICLFNYLYPKNNDKVKFKVIGPAGAANLLGMIKELKWKFFKDKNLQALEIYTTTATAAEPLLLREATVKPLYLSESHSDETGKIPIQNLRCALYERMGIEFNRKICTDDQIASALIDELGSRGVDLECRDTLFNKLCRWVRVRKHDHNENPEAKDYDPYGGHRDHVVLVAECDTFFGRSLPKTFIDALKNKHNYGIKERDGQYIDDRLKVTWIHPYSYLRGLDGKVPGEQERDAKEHQKNSSDRKEEEDLQRLEEPVGKSQYDYLRRLAEEIYRLDQQLEREDHGSIKAIGVLGSDFYDKYLVLQALGQRFPNVVFFTTDLDARFLYSPYNKWTRNMIVASGFGLQLCDDLQGDVPPFRDTHQTSLFLATQCALDRNKKEKYLQRCLPFKPRIFEIGRTQAIDLTKDKLDPKISATTDSIHPQPHRPSLNDLKPRHFLYSFIFIVMLSLILYQSKTNIRDKLKATLRFITCNLDLVIIFGFLIYCFDNKILQDAFQEPFSWNEGVSAWPTEIVRLVAILLAWIFFFAASKQLKNNEEEIEEEFWGIKKEAPKLTTESMKLWQRFWLLRVPWNLYSWGTSHRRVVKECWEKYFPMARYYWWRKNEKPPDHDNTEKKISMDELWKEYQNRGKWHYRCLRAIPFVIVIGCVVYLAFISLNRPIRGTLSRNLDAIALFAAAFSFYSLTFFVFDNTRLCRRFVNLMILKSKAQWSSLSLAQFIPKVGRAEEGLKDLMFVRLIAKRTEAVGKQIFYPFIILVVLLMARSHYFDNWRLSAPLLGFIAILSLSYTWSCAVTLRRQAERTKAYIIRHLSKKLIQAMEDDPHQPRAEQLQFVLNEIKSTQSGAFAPFTQQPLVRALLVPFGGIGGLHLLNFLGK